MNDTPRRAGQGDLRERLLALGERAAVTKALRKAAETADDMCDDDSVGKAIRALIPGDRTPVATETTLGGQAMTGAERSEMRERLVVCSASSMPHSMCLCSCTEGHHNPQLVKKLIVEEIEPLAQDHLAGMEAKNAGVQTGRSDVKQQYDEKLAEVVEKAVMDEHRNHVQFASDRPNEELTDELVGEGWSHPGGQGEPVCLGCQREKAQRAAVLERLNEIADELNRAITWEHIPGCSCSQMLKNTCREERLTNAYNLAKHKPLGLDAQSLAEVERQARLDEQEKHSGHRANCKKVHFVGGCDCGYELRLAALRNAPGGGK